MDVATVDLWATSGRSRLHRASPTGKIIAGALCLSAVIVVENVLILVTVYLTMLAAARRAGVPLRPFIVATLYPGVFAVLFAFAQYHGDLIVPLTTVFKALSAASIVVLVIATTPYPRLFAALRPVLPAIVLDVLFVTYRSVFVLLDIFGDLLRTVRLRGGFVGRNVGVRLRTLGAAFGTGILNAFDVSERTYAVMRARGYSGGVSGERATGLSRHDWPLLLAAAALTALAWWFRFDWRALNPYSWFPPVVAAVALAVALVLPAPRSGAVET